MYASAAAWRRTHCAALVPAASSEVAALFCLASLTGPRDVATSLSPLQTNEFFNIDLTTLLPRCRMASEETFSFRVRELAPAALRVLDMQDMEALRRGAPPGCRRPCRPAAMVCGSAQKSEGKTRSQAAPLSYSSHRQCGEVRT